VRLGKVLAYEPPTSIVLAWQLNQDWKYDASFVTELEVRFVAEGTATRVELEHRNLDRFGARADALHADLDSQEAWTGALVAFAAYLDRSLAEGGSEMSDSQFFLCRFIPPRPNFATTMSADEREIMQAHVGYWNGQLQAGSAIAFGPVADPRGDWGVGIVGATDERAVQRLRDADPAILSGRGFHYEILPMPRLMTRS